MIHRRTVLLVSAALLATLLVTSTSGVSTMTMERGFHGAVADDDSAYIGFDQHSTMDNGTTTVNVTVTNRFPTGADLKTVDVTLNETTVDLANGDPLAPGESVTHSFDGAECGAPITVEASNADVSVHLDRTVVCE